MAIAEQPPEPDQGHAVGRHHGSRVVHVAQCGVVPAFKHGMNVRNADVARRSWFAAPMGGNPPGDRRHGLRHADGADTHAQHVELEDGLNRRRCRRTGIVVRAGIPGRGTERSGSS